MLLILNCIALCIFQLGTYFIWFDRRNVFNLLPIGFCFSAYIFPLIVFDYSNFYSKSILDLYYKINILGALFFILGILLGNKWKRIKLIDLVLNLSFINKFRHSNLSNNKFFFYIKLIYLISMFGMIISFVLMGFVPMFSSDPLTAKQFKGPYHESYQRVALIYRTAKQFVQLLLPLFVIEYYTRKKYISLLFILAGLVLIAVTLSRSETVTALILTLSIFLSLKLNKIQFIFYAIFLVFFFSFGSASWVILGLLFPNSDFATLSEDYKNNANALQAIASGAPDIFDQLDLLDSFVHSHFNFTYGRTFIGGLVPNNYEWNPSVWTLKITNDSDITEIASGGLRVPVSMWGFYSFGWVGVILVTFLSGFNIGYITKRIKFIINKLKPKANDYLAFYLIIFVYTNIAFVFTNFYVLSIYVLPAFVFYYYIINVLKIRK